MWKSSIFIISSQNNPNVLFELQFQVVCESIFMAVSFDAN